MTNDHQQGKPEPQIVYVKQAENGFAIAALCVGVAGVAVGLALYILFPIALVLGGVAVVLGAVGRHNARSPARGARRWRPGVWRSALLPS